jgi:hypothetical protein
VVRGEARALPMTYSSFRKSRAAIVAVAKSFEEQSVYR